MSPCTCHAPGAKVKVRCGAAAGRARVKCDAEQPQHHALCSPVPVPLHLVPLCTKHTCTCTFALAQRGPQRPCFLPNSEKAGPSSTFFKYTATDLEHLHVVGHRLLEQPLSHICHAEAEEAPGTIMVLQALMERQTALGYRR